MAVVVIPPAIKPVEVDAGFIKFRIGLQAAGYSVGCDMEKLAKDVAEKLAVAWRARAVAGLDVDGRPLPPIPQVTRDRRRRRGSADLVTPMHESGRYAKSIKVRVRKKGKSEGSVAVTARTSPTGIARYGTENLRGVSEADGGSVEAMMAAHVEAAMASTLAATAASRVK